MGKWAVLYDTKEWKALRARRLKAEPLCRMCKGLGIDTRATVVDHIKRHRGNRNIFFDYNLTQSLCKPHHDSLKQSEERLGYSKAVGSDGWPVDPKHPINAGAKSGTLH